MSDSVTIRVPLDPPAALFPNRRHRRGGFHEGVEAAYQLRLAAKLAAMPHAPATALAGPVALHVHVAYSGGRRLPDLDASASAAKAAIDGVVDGGILVNDRQVTALTVTHERLGRGEQGYTDLTICEVET